MGDNIVLEEKYDESRSLVERCVKKGISAYGEDSAYISRWYSRYVDALNYYGKEDDAWGYCNKAIRIGEEIHENDADLLYFYITKISFITRRRYDYDEMMMLIHHCLDMIPTLTVTSFLIPSLELLQEDLYNKTRGLSVTVVVTMRL